MLNLGILRLKGVMKAMGKATTTDALYDEFLEATKRGTVVAASRDSKISSSDAQVYHAGFCCVRW